MNLINWFLDAIYYWSIGNANDEEFIFASLFCGMVMIIPTVIYISISEKKDKGEYMGILGYGIIKFFRFIRKR